MAKKDRENARLQLEREKEVFLQEQRLQKQREKEGRLAAQ